jgi:hypothetical protein
MTLRSSLGTTVRMVRRVCQAGSGGRNRRRQLARAALDANVILLRRRDCLLRRIRAYETIYRRGLAYMKNLKPITVLAALTLAIVPAHAQSPKAHPDITADTTTGNRVLPHMAAGGGWDTTVALLNLGSAAPTTHCASTVTQALLRNSHSRMSSQISNSALNRF